MKKIILLIILFMLTGCYDYRELNTLSIVSAISIDYKDNLYYISAEVINPQAPDKTAVVQAPFIMYYGSGKTMQEAYRNLATKTSRALFSSHLGLLLVSENIKGRILEDVIDFYARNPGIRTEFYIMSYDTDNPLELVTPINKISSSSIIDTVDTNKKYLGTTFVLSFNDLLNKYLNKDSIVIPRIEIINNKEDKDVVEDTNETNIETLYNIKNGIIYNNKLDIVGYLEDKDIITYNYIKNDIENSIIVYECNKDKYITMEVINNKTNIKYKDNSFNIEIKIDGNINENQCNINNIKDIENGIEEYFNKYIEDNINNINKYKIDIFGFKDIVYKNYYKYYDSIKNKEINEFDYNIKSNINIISTGNVRENIYEED